MWFFEKWIGKFTKGKDNLNLILSNQRGSYKNGLSYQPNKSFISIFHAKKNINQFVYKCNDYHKIGHLEYFLLC